MITKENYRIRINALFVKTSRFSFLWFLMFVAISILGPGCNDAAPPTNNDTLKTYFTNEEEGLKTGGVKMVRIVTSKGPMHVWTKRFGNSPTMKLLLLNGGPGATHEYFECMESFLPAEGIELIYYDQLGCGLSDNPDDTAFWDLDRYVEEVEQVRNALGLDKENFYLLGHSWGGILAMQYSLKYQDKIKGLIISNMMSSCPDYDKYADDVLAKQLDTTILKEIRAIEAKSDYANPRYMEILNTHFYEKHVLRMPMAAWPEPAVRSLSKTNQSLYVTMQGPSEFGIAGRLANWDVKKNLKDITVPTLVIGATHDTMDPEHMKWMATEVQNGSFLLCPNGSHMALYDDQQIYMSGLTKFILGVNKGEKKIVLNPANP